MNDIIVQQINISMRDGILLKADLFLKDDSLPHFTLLQRTPYPRETSISSINALELARLGWAVVIQNVRGRLGSEGEFLPFLQEKDDGVDTINWILNQSWSNGRVAMSGTSYCGSTQWSCAYSPPSGLGAISPQISASNVLDHWFYENGIFRQAFAQSWGLGFAHTSEASNPNKKRIISLAKNLHRLYKIPSPQSPLNELFPPYKDWIKKNNNNYWKIVGRLNKSNVPHIPAFHLTGWFDIFCEGALEDYSLMYENSLALQKVNQRIIIGPWGHNTLFHQRTGQLNFGYYADGFSQDIMGEIHHWLYDALNKNPLKCGAKVFIMGENRWKEYSTWPPKADKNIKFYFADHLLNSRIKALKSKQQSTRSLCFLEHNPLKLPISLGGRTLDPASSGSGSFDHSSVLNSLGETLFVSDMLKDSLTVVGEVFVNIFITSCSSVVDLHFTILDKHPDGKMYNIVSKTHRKSLVPDKLTLINLSLGSTAIKFKKNHFVCLRITSSNFPHLEVSNLNKKKSKINILFGSDCISYISLPIQLN